MSSTWELNQWNVWVDHLKINYKIVLKAVTSIYANIFEGGNCFAILGKLNNLPWWQLIQFNGIIIWN